MGWRGARRGVGFDSQEIRRVRKNYEERCGGNGVRVWDADAGVRAWVSADEGMGDEAR